MIATGNPGLPFRAPANGFALLVVDQLLKLVDRVGDELVVAHEGLAGLDHLLEQSGLRRPSGDATRLLFTREDHRDLARRLFHRLHPFGDGSV